MGFLGIRSVSESEGQRLVKMFAPQIASMRKARADKAAAASTSMERPIMKISRPPLPGKFVKIASPVGGALETMVGM